MSRDVLRTLAAARPAELDPDAPVDPATRAAELARARTGHSRAERVVPRRRVRPMWGLGLVGAATAALVAATTLTGTGTDSPTTVRPGASGAPRAMDARTVLLAAADQADKQTEDVRAYWYQATVARNYLRATSPQGDYTVVSEERSEGWTPSAPGGRQWGRQQSLGVRPATKADQAAWQRAGSPSTFQVKTPVAPKGRAASRYKNAELNAAPGKPQLSSTPLVDGDKVFWLGRNVTMKDLRSLPADPARLKKSLLRWYKGHDTESSSVPMASDEWLFQVTRGLVIDMPVKPEVRAAAFRMLAELKTVRSVGEVKDAQGRTGAAVAVTTSTPNGVLQHRLIIDPGTGNALSDEIVVLKPAGANANLPAGTPLQSTTVIKTTWTDSAPR
ncbi:CU044_5270 family protein [Actinomadura miaoliensis]|uniref:CU044_5270 family protein n=1 Tax=Actinomadura miaoliensis TaxID=430685 RepID=A0ABP7W226_9ACTN